MARARPADYLLINPNAVACVPFRRGPRVKECSPMRLVHLCDMRLAFDDVPVLVRPYGGEEGTSFGQGGGTVEGDRLHGTARWVNLPHRRSDGAMLPNIHGVITTPDGASILFRMRGRTVWRATRAGITGNQVLGVLFETEDERHRWLNDAVCVLEGMVLPPGSGRPLPISPTGMRVYACENDLME